MKPRILFIDDEEDFLSLIPQIFNDQPYEIVLAIGGVKGIEMIKEGTFSVVISDLMMPDIHGIEVLRIAKDLCPNAIRMGYSAYFEQKVVSTAIEEGVIWKCLAKPMDNEDLISAVKEAVEKYEEQVNRG